MQFKNPELLYALFLLLIPVIVHLFQLRKFQKEAFTNVAFLKRIVLQTRKSSQLKKWLTLLIRLGIFAAIILAFARPYTSKNDSFKTKNEIVIYLDNSFSMQAKGNQGELLKRAIQDLIGNLPNDEKFTLITNDKTFKNVSVKNIQNDLLQIGLSSEALSYKSALLKCKSLFSNVGHTKKQIVFISDFQKNSDFNAIKNDSIYNTAFVKLSPVNTNNIAIDSAYISNKSASNKELTVSFKNSGAAIENLPISLYNDDKLIAKTAISINGYGKTNFSLPNNTIINGKVLIDDGSLTFDNSLFFNVNASEKINVLSITADKDNFLKRIYTDDEFNFNSSKLNQLNYSVINNQHVIVLNALENIPHALIIALKSFTNEGGHLVIIPPTKISKESYNTLLSSYQFAINDLIASEKRITTINYAHPLFKNGVFEKEVKNFQYPRVSNYYNINSLGASSILKFEDDKNFLSQRNNVYLFSAAIQNNNSNFIHSPLIVPTLYNIGKNSLKSPILYYNIGKENSFDVITNLQQDDVLKLVNTTINIIPRQQYFNNKVLIKTSTTPNVSGVYAIQNKKETIQSVSYNYNRTESDLIYYDDATFKNVDFSTSIPNIFDSIKSDSKVNDLWKWFVIFALVLLIIEMLILKYFK